MNAIHVRDTLPDERFGVTHHFCITAKRPDDETKLYDVDGYITVSLYPDGRLGEVFIKCGKQGEFNSVLGQWARLASYVLQYGMPAQELLPKFLGTRLEPSGATTNPDIPRCTSVLDYFARWVLMKYFNDHRVLEEAAES
jgi:ribonucleoside-diphosphate reductase alpha chain